MNTLRTPITILIAEDDADDRFLTKDAFERSLISNNIHFVEDGEELMDYLHHRGKYSDKSTFPRPGIILLDLNMPKKDGREALKEIKADDNLKRIPVIVLTTSQAEEDIILTYNLGVNSFIRKPVQFASFIETIKTFGKYWLEIVELPPIGTTV